MCIACSEFVKNKLNMKEYLAALWESTMEDEAHLSEVEGLISQARGRSEQLKEQLKSILDGAGGI
jgi:hypothetical protein